MVAYGAPTGITIHAGVAGCGFKTDRGSSGCDGKWQFEGEDFHARQSKARGEGMANAGGGCEDAIAIAENDLRNMPHGCDRELFAACFVLFLF